MSEMESKGELSKQPAEQANPQATEMPLAASPPPAPATTATKPKPSAWKRWAKRFRLTFLILLLLFGIFRIALQFALPSVIHRTAARYGLTATYERHEIDLFGGDVGLWHLVLAPKEGGDPLVKAEYCRGDVSTIDLLRGRLLVRRLEAEGLDVLVERGANGKIALLDRFISPTTQPAAKVVVVSSPTGPREINLSSPFQMDAFRLDRVRMHLRDLSVTPPLEAHLETNLRLTDLKSLVRPTRFEMEVSAAPVLDSLRISGEGTSGGKNLDAKMTVALRGLHPRKIEPYLRPLGIRPLIYNLAADMSMSVKTTATTQPNCLAAAIALDGVSLSADGEESLALDHLSINIGTLSETLAQITKVAIDGVRANATRSAKGDMRVAGLEFVPLAAGASEAGAVATIQPSTAPFKWSIAGLTLTNLNAAVEDLAVTPSTTLQLAIEKLSVGNLLNDPKSPVTLAAKIHAPGTAKTIDIAGTASPFTDTKSADLKLAVGGIQPDALRPYLDAAGLESDLKNGSLTANIHAAISSDKTGRSMTEARLSDVRFSDGAELLALNNVRVTGFGLDALTKLIHVDSVEIAGPRIGARREASGALSLLGFHTKTATNSTPSTQPLAIPKIELGKFVWKDVHLTFEDNAVTPPTHVELNDVGVEISELLLDLDPKSDHSKQSPARVSAWIKAPGVVGNVMVSGTITPNAQGPVAELDITGNGLKAGPLVTYLKAAGIEPVLKDGSLQMKARLATAQTKDGMGASLELTNLHYEDQGKELAGVDRVSIPKIDIHNNTMTVDEITIDKPRFALAREKNGTMTFAGVHTLPTTMPAKATASVDGEKTIKSVPPPSVTIVNKMRVTEAEIRWTDRQAAVPTNIRATATVGVERFVYGKPGVKAGLQLDAKADGCIDNLHVTGTFSPSQESPEAQLEVRADGVRAGPLAAYLPAELEPKLKDGHFHATIDAGVSPAANGGTQGRLIVTNLDYRDGAAVVPLLKLDSLRVILSRFDQAAKVIALNEISLSGLETSVHQTASGPQLFGFILHETEQATKPAADAAAATVAVKPAATTAPVALGAASGIDQPAAQPAKITQADIARAVAQTRKVLPLVTVEKINLDIKSLILTDAARPSAAPIAITDFHFQNRSRIEMLGDKPEERPAADFELSCKPGPIADSFSLGAKVSPFALQPTFQIEMEANGIKGDGLLAAMPELKEKIDGKALTDGRFKAHVEATVVKIDRRDLLHFDLSRPIDADFDVKNLEFRNGSDGPVLAGLEEIRSDGIHIEPATGGMQAKSVEITNIVGSAVREADGIHTMGIVIRLPGAPPSTQPTTQPTTQPATQQPATQNSEQPATMPVVLPTTMPTTQTVLVATPAKKSPATRPAGEIRIDKLVMGGMNFRLEDRTVDPPMVLPINSFELDARDFSNLMLFEDRSCRFSLLVNASKVTLPRPLKKKGLAGALSDMAGGPQAEAINATEERELFSQITASGKVSLYPEMKGWIKSSMSGFELAALKGEAKSAGFNLSGGTLDTTVDVRLRGDGSMDLTPKFVFVDMEVNEPNGGPVVRYLQLPGGLDIVIKALQDPAGQITVPLTVQIEKGKVSIDQIKSSVIGAVGSIVTVAIASAPIKVAEGIGSIIGLDFKGKKEAPLAPIVLSFAAGDTAVNLPDSRVFDALLKRIAKDKTAEIVIRHELGAGDVDREASRANPSPEDVQNLAFQLRQQKMELLKTRAQVAGQARGELGSGIENQQTLDRLRALDRELGVTEDGLDQMYDLLRPGADRQAKRRTRTACLAVGQERLSAIREILINSGVPELAKRIRIVPAQYNPVDDLDGGRVTIESSQKK